MGRLLLVCFVAGCVSHNSNSDQDLSVAEMDLSVAPDLATTSLADLSVLRDLAGSVAQADLSTLPPLPDLLEPGDLRPVTTTVHAIDVGQIDNGSAVAVAGLVLTGVPRVEGTTTTGNRCIYGAYAQDPSGAAPCGLRLFVVADPCIPTDMGTCRCPQPPNTGTLFDVTDTLGDLLTVSGTVDVFTPVGLASQHSVKVFTLDKIGSGGVITPLDVSDPTPFAKNGLGYTSDENMVVSIHPAAPSPFGISALDTRGNFTGGGAQFSGIYRFYYVAPVGGSSFTSITGVAQISFGGVAPRLTADFVP